MVRIVICGDKQWSDYGLVEKVLSRINSVSRIECLIEGGRKGVDEWAFFAILKIQPTAKIVEMLPNWQIKNTGSVLNQQMLDEGKPDLVVAFHDDIDEWTKDMLEKAKERRIPVILINHETKLREEDELEKWF